MKKDEKGFSLILIILLIVVVGLIAAIGWFVFNRQKNSTIKQPVASNTQQNSTSQIKEQPKNTDSNVDYLVVKEWGIKFKVPSGLADVKYVIREDTAAFFAKPNGSSVLYRSDYDRYADGNFKYASGVLYRSMDSTKSKLDADVQGKKIGDYYYYSEWAFSGLATGAACVGLYGESNETNCKPEGMVFGLVNQGDGALLNTIELAQ